MTNAPERIWVVPDMDDVPRKHWDCGVWRDDKEDALEVHGGPVVEYIRAVLLEAYIGVALEKAAECCDCATQDGIGDILRGRADDIRALRPDAMQALERVRREAEQRGEKKWFADAKLMLGFADLAYEFGAYPTSSELLAAKERVLERVRREARVEGMRAALDSLEGIGFTAPAKRGIRALIAAEERGKETP